MFQLSDAACYTLIDDMEGGELDAAFAFMLDLIEQEDLLQKHLRTMTAQLGKQNTFQLYKASRDREDRLQRLLDMLRNVYQKHHPDKDEPCTYD